MGSTCFAFIYWVMDDGDTSYFTMDGNFPFVFLRMGGLKRTAWWLVGFLDAFPAWVTRWETCFDGGRDRWNFGLDDGWIGRDG
jgi:hypothetical protein